MTKEDHCKSCSLFERYEGNCIRWCKWHNVDLPLLDKFKVAEKGSEVESDSKVLPAVNTSSPEQKKNKEKNGNTSKKS